MKNIFLILLSSALLNARWDYETHYMDSLDHVNYLVERLNKAKNVDQRMDYSRWLAHSAIETYALAKSQLAIKYALEDRSNNSEQNFMVNSFKS